MLTREDWNDISKLTITGEPGSKIIEVKILESFIGEKPYPVIVAYKNAFHELKWSQYSIEGIYSGSKDNFQIVKVSEPQEDRYLKPLLFIMKNSLPIAKGPDDTFLSDLSAWSLITAVNQHKSFFTVQGSRLDFSEIEKFVIMINNQELPFNDFINYLPKVNSVLKNIL
jgi:hypothetical protein